MTATLSRRRLIVLIASLGAAALAGSLAVVLLGSPGTPQAPATGPVSAAGIARLHAVEDLLRVRGAAIVHRDRAAFLSTLDPRARRFRHDQARTFAHLAPVPIATWTYSVSAVSRRPPPDARGYHAPTWAPQYFALHYRLAGFDAKPTTLQQYPTFVERGGHWYLASLSDYAPNLVSATDIWDYGPVKVLRRPDVLVIGAPSRAATMSEVARQVHAAIGQVSAVWGSRWSRRAVVLVPRTTRQMALIDDYPGDLSNLAALTSAEVSTTAGKPTPVGDRITINPANWPMLSEIGAGVVIRHELTHVATRASTGTQTPTWLSEGFADYVGFRTAPVSVELAASALARRVRAGMVPVRLPSNRDFRSTNPLLAVHYEAAWLACRYIAEQFGQPALVRFYRAVGTSPERGHDALVDALRDDLHLRLARFVAQWRGYVERVLG